MTAARQAARRNALASALLRLGGRLCVTIGVLAAVINMADGRPVALVLSVLLTLCGIAWFIAARWWL